MNRSQADIVREKVATALGRIGVRAGEKILVAISGGSDSVALLHLMRELSERFGYRVATAHLNHALRGDESDRDEAFVRELCARLAVELIVERASGLSSDMPNLEESARDLRRDFLGRAANLLGASRIALGHHADDQAETVLMRLMRGAGPTGLAAMRESGEGGVIRPLLRVTRGEIEAYLKMIGAEYVTDTSNSSLSIVRNRIRHELLPMIEREYSSGLRGRLIDLADSMREVDDLLLALARERLAAAVAADGSLDLRALALAAPALAAVMLREFIAMRLGSLRRVQRVHIDALRRLCAEGPPNGSCDLPGRWTATRRYDRLALIHRLDRGNPLPGGFSIQLAAEGHTSIEPAGFRFEVRLVLRAECAMPDDPMCAVFDADEVEMRGGLVAKSFRPGDRISSIAGGGTSKVKKLFIDHRVPPLRRANWPLVALGDEIAWLPGLKRGKNAPITAQTERVMGVRAVDLSAAMTSALRGN
jgi:tRNA(Ile)-lysidine synthase